MQTLGCRLNQYETNVIRNKLEEAGYRIVPFDSEADLAVINTCSVTNAADAKSRNAIRRFTRVNPRAVTVVVGCYSQVGYKEITEIPGVDYVIGNNDKLNFLDYLDEEKPDRPVIIRDRIAREDFSVTYVGDAPFEQRANLKVQDGCDFMCSFCIIPFTRGRARSRDFANLLDEARSLAGRGVRELVLTGVNLGEYSNSGKGITEVTDALGEIEVPKTLSETAQRERVAQIERNWRDQQPTIEGEKVLLPGYESHVLDTSREIQYNKLTVNQQGDVQATMHRPLREGKPWAFHGLEGVSADSLEETDGQCVSHQLSKHIKIKGKDPPWTQQLS